MNNKDFIESLENTEKPEITLKTHKAHLYHVLSQEMNREKNIERKRGIFMISSLKLPKILVPVMSIIMLLVVGVFIFTASPVTAYVTLQVNPALEFALDKDNNVISVEVFNDDAKLLIKDLKVVDEELDDALVLIVSKANELGFVTADKEFILTFRSAKGDSNEEYLYKLAKDAELAVRNAISEKNLTNNVRTAVISSELFETALKAGLLPSDYFDLIEANVSQDKIIEVIKLSEMQGIDPKKYFDEFHTVSSAIIDLLEAGIDESKIMSMLEAALVADKTIEEFSTIVAAMIDIHEAGGDPAQIIRLIKSATEANISNQILFEEIKTLTAAYIDMIDEGISESAAFALLTNAMKADASLEEISTISAAFIDLIESGFSESQAMDMIKEAIKTDPTLDSFDDLLEKMFNENEESEAYDGNVDEDKKSDAESDEKDGKSSVDEDKKSDANNVDVDEDKKSDANNVGVDEDKKSDAESDEKDGKSSDDSS